MLSGRDWRDVALLAAVTTVATVLLIGDFGVTLANSVGDDSPAVFSRLLLDPALFSGDIISTYGRVYALGTIVHWGPAVAWRAFGIPPEWSAIALVFLQNVLFVCAVWVLARMSGGDRATAWIAACFARAAEVYIWNLASFRSQMAIPYGAHLVLAFLLLAVIALIRAQHVRAAVWLALATLTHPTMTLLSLPPIALTLLWSEDAWRVRIKRVVMVMIPAVVVLTITVWLVRGATADPMSHQDQLTVMRGNVHMNPFRTQHFWTILLPTAATFAVLLAIATPRLALLQPFYRKLLGMSMIVCAGYAVAHIMAVRLGSTTVLTLIPLRFMSVLVVWSMPAIAGALLDRIRSGDIAQRWAAVSLLILHPLSPLGAYWPALVALLMGKAWTPLRIALLVAWLGAAILVSFHIDVADHLLYGTRITASTLVAALVLAGVIAFLPQLLRTTSWLRPIPALIVMLPLLLLTRNAVKGAETRSGPQRDLYDAQRWARMNTPPNAAFIIEPNVSWRVVSQRGARQLWPPDAYVYSHSKTGLEFATSVKRQYARAPFRNNADVRAFQDQFGGDYLLRYATRSVVGKPVYRNDEFVIYQLSGSGQ